MKDKIIVIVGPTAVGKTALSIDLAEKLNGEVVNADAMQIYRHLDIGTAKITEKEAGEIPHHLLDIRNPDESYTVAEFQQDARQAIAEIIGRGALPIIVGGSGLYTESLIYDVSHGGQAKPNAVLRQKLEKEAAEKGGQYLWERLNQIDPVSAISIHPNNKRRVIRALEVYYESGKKFSDLQQERKKREMLYDPLIIGLDTDRSLLYERINQRVEWMIQAGLVQELQEIVRNYGDQAEALKGIGYKELLPYLNGQTTLDEAITLIQKNSRHYAKRQLTWFRNRLPVTFWADTVQNSEAIQKVERITMDFLQGVNE